MVCLLVIVLKVFDAAATVKTVPPLLSYAVNFAKMFFPFFSFFFFTAPFAPFLHFLLFGHFFYYFHSTYIIGLQTRYYICVFK